MGLLTNVNAACNWKTDVVRQGSNYLFSKDCYKAVGILKVKAEELEQANNERKAQVKKQSASIKLKDLALDKADQRLMNWRSEAYNQHERLLKQQKLAKFNDWLYFGSGIALTVLSVWGAGQLK